MTKKVKGSKNYLIDKSKSILSDPNHVFLVVEGGAVRLGSKRSSGNQ